MIALEKNLKSVKCLVFIDFEGTQFSHEIIEIGAIKVYINADCTIKRVFKPFHLYVKPKGKLGDYVENLTGIHEKILREEGVPFPIAINSLKKYLGKDFKGCRFLTYGNSDAAMIHYSILANENYDGQDAKWIAKRCFDFSSFLKNYVTDENGQTVSLLKALNVFEVKYEGHIHTALDDAKNLQFLYESFLSRKDIVEREYKKTLARKTNLPAPIQKVMNMLKSGKTVSPEAYDDIIKEQLK